MRSTRLIPLVVSAVVLAGSVLLSAPPGVGAPADGPVITTRVVKGGQVTRLVNSSGSETAPAVGPEAGQSQGPVANRSLSSKARATRNPSTLSGIPAPSTAVVGATGATSFSGINHHEQRLEVAGGNQWSLEPPDQGLCVGNGYVFEAVNNAVAVYTSSGSRLTHDSLNHFFGYPFEVDRTTGVAGPKQTTDPSCLYDPATGRFFVTILTYDSDTAGNPLAAGTNTIDTAVSSTSNPLGSWTITHIDATDDGTGGTPRHTDCPCIGDYPHVGVDANGFYVTTNEYPWNTDGFNGAQIYAMSKAQLVSGAESVRVNQVDTGRAAPGGQPGFTVWPSQSPTAAAYDTRAGGTEYFLSTNAAPEANGTGRSDQLLTWSLTNTTSLATGSTPDLGVHVVSSTVPTYALPLLAAQKVGSVPQADCLNITACAKVLFGTPDRYKEYESRLDSLDSRMQQVSYANGVLYGSHGTAVDVGTSASDVAQQSGVAWYEVRPTTAASTGNLTASVVHTGRLATARNNLTMPALGARSDGSAVMAMTLVGTDHYPSAAYVNLSASGATGPVRVLAQGAGPEDGFTGYRIYQTQPRWGDYGATAIDPATGAAWLASEWIGQTCTLAQYTADPFGQCGGTRTALANWSTRISRVP
jgi:hypothetical protein